MLARLLLAFATLVAGIWGLSASRPAMAQQDLDRIAAVVNDEIISLQELEGRLKIALYLSNIPDSMDNRRRIAMQVVRKMVDERLQMQEASRLKISLSSGELENGIQTIEQNNRLPKGALLGRLTQAGLDANLMRDQIKADLTWLRLTGRVLGGQMKVGEEEVTDRLDMIRDRQGKPEYLLSEIFLSVDNPSQEEDARKLGERLLEQVRGGAPFAVLAGQFSRSPTAGNGGNMGWVSPDLLEPELVPVVTGLGKGGISALLRAGGGYYILRLQDQRVAGQSVNSDESVVRIARALLPVPGHGPSRGELLVRAADTARTWRNCDDMDAWGRKQGITVQMQGPMKMAELPNAQRRSLVALAANQVAEPQDVQDGIQMLMMCSRQDSVGYSLPSRDQVRQMIESERMDMLSKRYIRDLRRAAFIDLRG